MSLVDSPRHAAHLSSSLEGVPPYPAGGLASQLVMAAQNAGVGGAAPHLSMRKRTKQEVCDAFLANLAARNNPQAGDAEFLESVHRHFQSLPTRYALDVNIGSLDVLNHRELLRQARSKAGAITIQVRHVDVVATSGAGAGQGGLGLQRPSFASLENAVQMEQAHASSSLPRLRSLPRPAFGSSPNLQALAAEVESREQEEAMQQASAEGVEFFEVTVASRDQPKLLSRLSEALGDMGLNICEAHAFNTTDKLVLDVFVVNGWSSGDPVLLEDTLARQLTQGASPVASPVAGGVINMVPQMLDEQMLSPAGAEPGSRSSGQQHDDWELDPADITFCAKLASGAFGDLYRGLYCGQEVAIKILRNVQNDSQQYQEFLQEVSIMRKVRHKNVVQFIGACTVKPNLCIVFEFMPGGSVYDYIRKVGALRPTTVLKIGMEVCRGMDYLHKRRIVHRDLKAANLLLDETGTVKIADFGVARVMDPQGVMTAETGTYRWMAPEVIEHNPYREMADVYSFGIVLWELATGAIPYSNMTPLQAAVGVVQKGLRPEIPAGCPEPLADLMRVCWVRNPVDRPTFEQLKGKLEMLYESSARDDSFAAGSASKGGGSAGGGQQRGFFAKFKGSSSKSICGK